ncbi:hypothetical protein B0H15DRAFT_26215 [Mycena belliarum]|uniref:Uncharacterized protein n=1 Tax=Mycena belliarum TaxID=1033014 RepID=A0AAD6Y0C5_9AGAR|nr:hypothetical protein B0H15DRAFT_26215 [Mycena belliae]
MVLLPCYVPCAPLGKFPNPFSVCVRVGATSRDLTQSPCRLPPPARRPALRSASKPPVSVRSPESRSRQKFSNQMSRKALTPPSEPCAPHTHACQPLRQAGQRAAMMMGWVQRQRVRWAQHHSLLSPPRDYHVQTYIVYMVLKHRDAHCQLAHCVASAWTRGMRAASAPCVNSSKLNFLIDARVSGRCSGQAQPSLAAEGSRIPTC